MHCKLFSHFARKVNKCIYQHKPRNQNPKEVVDDQSKFQIVQSKLLKPNFQPKQNCINAHPITSYH